jgi:hypothetical protein
VLDDQTINADATRIKMRKIQRYALDKEIYLQYFIGAIVILVAVFHAFQDFYDA